VPFARAIELGLNPPRGALIGDMDDTSAAKAAGLQSGDVILQFDGKEINEMADLPKAVAETPSGREVEVLIVRKGAGDAAPTVESKFLTVGELGGR
jgi:serine protease Do